MSRNSASVQATKTVKESLKDRWTDSQMMTALDQLIHLGIDPIIENTTFIDQHIPAILCWYATNTGRKISTVDKPRVLHLLNLYLLADRRKDKVRLFRKLKLERNIGFYLLARFLAVTEGYLQLEVRYAQKRLPSIRYAMEDFECATGGNRKTLGRVIQRVRSWTNEAVFFKNQIIERYFRHAVMQANRFSRDNERIEMEEVSQNFILAISKAVNKMDADKGVLTSYINRWIDNAKHSSLQPHEYGVAFSLSQHAKRKVAMGELQLVNISQAFDSEEVQSTPDPVDSMDYVVQEDRVARVRRLAKIADPDGYARRELGIEEHLYPWEVLAISGPVNKHAVQQEE